MSEEKIKEIFAKNLSNLLLESGKTQADLYKYLHVSSATVSDWCNAKKMPRMDKIQSICSWFQVEPSDLLEEKKKPSQRDEKVDNIIRLFASMSEEQQEALLSYAKYLSQNLQ